MALADAPPSLATQVGRASLQGFTAVFGLFAAPRRTHAPCELSFAGEADIATAYAHLRMQPPARAAAAAAAQAAAALTASAGSGRSVAELTTQMGRLNAKQIRLLMGKMGVEFVGGLEKDEYVEQLAQRAADEPERAEEALDEVTGV